MMNVRLSVVMMAMALTGCAIGAPPGFSSGDRWEFPLVGALEGGQLVVPAKVHGKGPYLFVFDPDSPVSQVDSGLQEELDLLTINGPEFVSEGDESKPTFVAEVLRIEIGNLTVRSLNCLVMPRGTFNVAGREIRGLIGRDFLADSLVFGFDRDRSMGYIATQQGFRAPENAIVVGYSTRIMNEAPSDIAAVRRRLVDVKVNGREYSLHVDLGEGVSQLRTSAWRDAGLVEQELQRELVDETGSARKVDRGGLAGEVTMGAARAQDVLFVPYDDRRWNERDVAGALGLDFFDDYVTWINWHKERLHLVPRAEIAAGERIGRWGPAFAGCATTGCVTVALELPAPQADATVAAQELPPDVESVRRVPARPPVLAVTRGDGVQDTAIEVMLEARDAAGARVAALPRLVAILPAGARVVRQPIGERYIGTTLQVVDVSPFARKCLGQGGCVYVLDR